MRASFRPRFIHEPRFSRGEGVFVRVARPGTRVAILFTAGLAGLEKTMRLAQLIDDLRLSKRRTPPPPLRWPEAWPAGRRDFAREFSRGLERLLQAVALVHSGASRRPAAERHELVARLEALRQHAKQLQRALAAYQHEDGHAWESFRRKAEDRWAELYQELRGAIQQYRSSRAEDSGVKQRPA